MPRSKTSQKAVSSQTSQLQSNEAGDVRFEDIRFDADGLVSEPAILAGLPVDQVASPRKRAEWLRLRKAGLVPAAS